MAHLSLCASAAADTRLRRLKRDAVINEMRNTLLHVRDIDGTAIEYGPAGATARQPINEDSSSPRSGKSSKGPVTTAPPEEVFAADENVSEDAVTPTISNEDTKESTDAKTHGKKGKSGKSEHISLSMGETDNSAETKPSKHHHHHHDKETKASKDTELSTPMSKAGKATTSKSTKESSSLSMQHESTLDSKAAKSGGESVEEMTEEANEFWAKYEAKTSKESSVESKANKIISLSMNSTSKAAKTERIADVNMSLPAGKAAKENAEMSMAKAHKIALSMDSKASKDHTVTMEITEDYVSHLDAKASKALSMDSHRLFSKTGKANHSMSM